MIQQCDIARQTQVPSLCQLEMEGPVLSLQGTFYPFGFPLEVRTNSPEMMVLMEETWGTFEKRFNYEPLRADIKVLQSDATECPPAPSYRLTLPLFTAIADRDN